MYISRRNGINEGAEEYAQWLLDVGDGKLLNTSNPVFSLPQDTIEIPSKYILENASIGNITVYIIII